MHNMFLYVRCPFLLHGKVFESITPDSSKTSFTSVFPSVLSQTLVFTFMLSMCGFTLTSNFGKSAKDGILHSLSESVSKQGHEISYRAE